MPLGQIVELGFLIGIRVDGTYIPLETVGPLTDEGILEVTPGIIVPGMTATDQRIPKVVAWNLIGGQMSGIRA
jgi:hypothetical protein